MNKFRILVIDEDILARQAVANVLQNEPNLEIRVSGEPGSASELVEALEPDIVLLNIERQGPNSFDTLKTMHSKYPGLPVVVLTPRNEKGAELALYALRHGAVDVITKPEQNSLLLFAGRHLVKRLRPTIAVASKLAEIERTERLVTESLKGIQHDIEEFVPRRKSRSSSGPLQLVVMGGCTGGPQALFSIIPNLPGDLPVPIAVVQHFPRHYTAELARSLNEVSELQVEEAYDGVKLVPGTVWVAPGGYHAEVDRDGTRNYLKLHRGPRENGVRPSIDLLFRSAGKILGDGVLGIVLSGCGCDGVAGARAIRENGGKIIVQDPREALAYELPLSVIKAGLAENYFTEEQIADQIIKRTKRISKGRSDLTERNENLRDRWYADRGDMMKFRSF